MVEGAHVNQAATECAAFLRSHLGADWTVGVPDLEMTAAGVVAHAAETCLWYAIDLAAGGKDLSPVEHRVKPDAEPEDLVDTLVAYALIAARTVDLAPPTARGFHPYGNADPSGFAAMACDELLIHTDDASRALEAPFSPSEELAGAVLRRLFPWVIGPEDSWSLLRWANGRVVLGGRPRFDRWRWHCAPLEEWSGQPPSGIASDE